MRLKSFQNPNSKTTYQAEGFTLIELLVVVAIIGILATIAISNYSEYRAKAQDAMAQSDVKNLATAEESAYGTLQDYVECIDPGDCQTKLQDYGFKSSLIQENFALGDLTATKNTSFTPAELEIVGSHKASGTTFTFHTDTGSLTSTP